MLDNQLVPDPSEKGKVSIQKEQEQKREINFVGKIIPHRGHKLFEIVNSTGEVREPDYIKQDFRFDPTWKPGMQINSSLSVMIKEGCSYVSALNKTNALKKWEKGDTGSRIDLSKSFLSVTPY